MTAAIYSFSDLILNLSRQCCGSVTFWYGSGSVPLTNDPDSDPDPTPDPAPDASIFVSDLQDDS